MSRTPNCGRARLVVAAAVILAGGCSSEVEDADYGAENREAFLAACTDGATDSTLVRDMCECTYDNIEESFDVRELAALEESLKIDSLASLPDPVTVAMAECFVAEADL